jgi:hypothetical protein
MFWQKSCPRCKGDLYQDSDVSGIYVACFQCGHYLPTIEEVTLPYPSRKGLLRHSIETTIDMEGKRRESGICPGSTPRPLQRLTVRVSPRSAVKKLTLEGG